MFPEKKNGDIALKKPEGLSRTREREVKNTGVDDFFVTYT
jgi:hypothetical protein